VARSTWPDVHVCPRRRARGPWRVRVSSTTPERSRTVAPVHRRGVTRRGRWAPSVHFCGPLPGGGSGRPRCGGPHGYPAGGGLVSPRSPQPLGPLPTNTPAPRTTVRYARGTAQPSGSKRSGAPFRACPGAGLKCGEPRLIKVKPASDRKQRRRP
jgi:hypothetical protein